ncbi:SCO7613 C-terminal domain-containing membrane protein [Microbacterium sp. HJ5]
MTDSDGSIAMWPRSPLDLENTHLCPACFTTLTSTTCERCGLVLADPRASRVLELGRSIVGIEAQRQAIIDEIRSAHAPVAPAPGVAPAVWWQAPVPAAPDASADLAAPGVAGPGVAAPDAPAVVSGGPAASPAAEAPVVPAASVIPRAPRRRLTVPVLLLIVGVSLVGVAAVFFLGLAWFVAGILVRALIIAGITAATIAGATLLRRGSLRATAEGVGALGVILLALDAYAVRANDLFGAGAADPFVYAGASALVVAAICRAWSVFSRLRGPDLAATIAVPAGIGLLVGGLLPVDDAAAWTAGLVGAAAGGLVHALPVPWSAGRAGRDAVVERTSLAVIGVASLAGAALVALVWGMGSLGAQIAVAAAIIAVGVAHMLVLRPRGDDERVAGATPLAATAGAIAATTAASLGWQLAPQSEQPFVASLLLPVVAVGVAVGLDRWAPRGRRTLAARLAAAVVAALSVAVLLLMTALRGGGTASSWVLWGTDVSASPSAALPDAAYQAIAAVIVAAALFVAPTLGRRSLRHVRPAVAALLLIAGAAGLGIPLVLFGSGVAVAAIAVFALARGGSPVGWGVAAGLGAATAYASGLTSPWLWTIGVGVAIAVPIAARLVLRPSPTARVGLVVAAVGVAAVSALIAPSAIAAALDVTADARSIAPLLQWLAVAVLAGALAPRLDRPTGNALAVASFVLTGLSLVPLVAAPVAGATVSTAIGEPLLGIVRATVLLVLLAVVALGRSKVSAPAPALAAAALLGPVAACVAIAIGDTAGTSDGATVVAVGVAAALVVWAGAPAAWGAFGAVVVGAPVPDPPASEAPVAPPSTEGADAGVPTVTQRAGYPVVARRLSDLGALAVVTVTGWTVSADLVWVLLAIIAAGFGGAAATRDWAGPRADRPRGVLQTRAVGTPTAGAPRRLLAWPAFAAATLALWSWLDSAGDLAIEAYVLPPAVGLLAFSVLLVWLRRDIEATIAALLATIFGLIVPAVDGLDGSPVRGTVVAAVSTVVVLALAWTPLRRVRLPAVAGAAGALAALGVVASDRVLPLGPETAWLLVLVAVSFVAAWGFLRTLAGARPVAVDPEGWFGIVVPPLALAVAVVVCAPLADEPLVVAISLAVLGALHLAAAALDRLPLAMATRWTAFAGAVVTALLALVFGDPDAIELLTLPLAAMLLGGAALAMVRRHRRADEGRGADRVGAERIAWLAGLALAVAPSVVAEPADLRTWLVIAGALLAAIGCVIAPLPDAAGLRTPSAMVLTAGALAMGTRALVSPAFAGGEFAAVTAGAGALLVAAAIVWMSDSGAPRGLTLGLGAAGAVLLVVTVAVGADGGLARTAITALVGGVVGVGGARLLGRQRWAGLGAILAVAGLAGALIAVAARYLDVLIAVDPGIEADLWAVAGVGITTAVGVMAVRATASRVVARVVGAGFSAVLVLFAVSELLLLGAVHPDWRTVLTMSAIVVVGLVGVVVAPRLGAALATTAAVAATLFGVAALLLAGVRPVELVTVPLGAGLLVLGARRMRRDPHARSWPTLGPGLALLTLPSLAYDFGESALWRVVALGIVAIALVVLGAVRRLQAPLVLGSVVLLVHAVAQLWPWISGVYVAVPWWLWLGIGGAVLIFLAARYEKQMRALRAAFSAVTSLR